MKKAMIIFAALAAILVMSMTAIAMESYVRWNNQLDECVYFYDKAGGRGYCFVAEENCASKDPRVNELKTVDPVGCYTIPRKEQKPAECVTFTEGQEIVLQYEGNDPDKNVGPAGKLTYTFERPFSKEGKWRTKRGDAGEYTTTVTVSDGQYTDTAEVCFTIISGNHAPELRVDGVTVKEGESVILRPECTDEDGDAVKLSFSGKMSKAAWKTGYEDAGSYDVGVTCTDTAGASDAKTVKVVVEDVNKAPLLEDVRDVTVEETETVRLSPRCADPEGQRTRLTYSGDMDSATWKTGYEDAGVYRVKVTCEDESGLSTSETAKVTVTERNRPPSITAMAVAG